MDELKNIAVKEIKSYATKGLYIALIFGIVVALLAGSLFTVIWAESTNCDDMSDAPYASKEYSNNITVSSDGTISSSTSGKQLWEEMKENKSNVNKYLDTPEEFLKLINAETITQFPDLRENFSEEYDWSKVNNVEESTIQGIIKFKRKDAEGNEILLTYKKPSVFNEWVQNGNQEALKHFTLEANPTVLNNTSGTGAEDTDGDVWYWPAQGTTITSYFGLREAPTEGASTNHGGIDIGAATGDNIYACDGGTVIVASDQGKAGLMVSIDHGNGYITKYMHNSEIKVSVGDTVSKGQVVALAGSTGVSTGPHLHFQVEYNGAKVDPMSFKYNNGMSQGTITPSITNSNANANSNTNSSYYVKVATWSSTDYQIESDDPEFDEEPDPNQYNLTTTNINYQQAVKGYTMPFQYLWTMLVITDDKDFVMQLADLAYNSEIVITLYDNITTNTNVEKYNYNKKKKTQTYFGVKATGKKGEDVKDRTKNGTEQDIKTNNYTTTYTTVTKINTLSVDLTYADVWMAKYKKDYTQESPDSNSNVSTSELEDIGFSDVPKIEHNDTYGHAEKLLNKVVKGLKDEDYTIVSQRISYINEQIYYSYLDRKKEYTNTIENSKYVSSPMDIQKKDDKNSEEENFVTILTKNKKAERNIISIKTWLFKILEETTPEYVDLTKYLLYKATGTSYGVTDFDFEIFNSKNFNTLSDMYGSVSNVDGVPGQIYDFLLAKGVPPIGAAAILGNIENESSFIPNNTNGTHTGLCQWSNDGRFLKLKDYANSKGISWTDVIIQMEFMWSELESSYTSVKNIIMSSTEEDDLEYATWYFGRHFEVYFEGSYESTRNDSEPKERYDSAKKWYKAWQENHTDGAVNVQVGEAAKIQGTDSRIQWLYDGKDLPTTPEENNKYLETFPVEYLDINGNLRTMDITMHRKLKTEVQAIFKEMVSVGFKVIGGNISYRKWGTDSGYKGRFPQSAHTYGHAFDINPDQNYYYNSKGSIVGKYYKPGSDPYSVTPTVVNIWKKHGFYWGGDWTSLKDYMHFSYFNH